MNGLNKIDTVLILAPHTDDGELGCGGLITKLLEHEKNVHYIAFSKCEASVPEGLPKDILARELNKALSTLGIPEENIQLHNYPVRKFPTYRQDILEGLVQTNKTLNPDLVILPNSKDIHQDHKTIYEEGVRAFKRNRIIGYELPWNNFISLHNMYVLLEEHHLQTKIESLAQYESQKHKTYFNKDFIRSLAHTRGTQFGRSHYAECFEMIRWFL